MSNKEILIKYLKAQIADIEMQHDKIRQKMYANPAQDLIELRRDGQRELSENPTLFATKVRKYATQERKLLAEIRKPVDIIALNKELVACDTIRTFLYGQLYQLENF